MYHPSILHDVSWFVCRIDYVYAACYTILCRCYLIYTVLLFTGLMAEVKFPDSLQDSKAKSLIEQLIAKDPVDRPRFHGIKNHPWMSELEFDAMKLKEMKLPVDWVQKHAYHESKAKPKAVRRNSMAMRTKTDISLNLFIEEICAQMMDLGKSTDAEQAAARWMTAPSSKTMSLFRHWNYISDDALKLEMNAAKKYSSRFVSRRHSVE